MSTKVLNSSHPQPPATAKIRRGHSCLLCSQRKIKCTGQKPCAACVKARVECVTKPNATPQRRKTKLAVAKEDILTRLQRCEEQLRRNGIKYENGSGSESPERSRDDANVKQNGLSAPEPIPATGMVVTDRSRYFVNKYHHRTLLC